MPETVEQLLRGRHYDRALQRLLDEYQHKVYRMALAMLRDSARAEDVTQDIFVKLWRALPLYDGRASFSTWLYVIARNACLNEVRRRGLRPTAALDEEAERAAAVTLPSPIDRRLECETLVEALPEPQRRIVRLFYLEERSYEQVAQMLEMPINTVRSHLHRARRRLAQITLAQKTGALR